MLFFPPLKGLRERRLLPTELRKPFFFGDESSSFLFGVSSPPKRLFFFGVAVGGPTPSPRLSDCRTLPR